MQTESSQPSEKTARILLDTTFLLPFFGIDVGLDQFETKFTKIVDKFEVLYNSASLIEAKWIVLGAIKKEKQKEKKQKFLDAYVEGLGAIVNPLRRLSPLPDLTSSRIEIVADYILFKYDVNDYFDRLVYASAAVNKAIVLTQDRKLIDIGKQTTKSSTNVLEGGMDLDKTNEKITPLDVISWAELLKRFRI